MLWANCHALGCSCLRCRSLVALFCGICCAGTGNILDLQHIISYLCLHDLQFQRWELLCPAKTGFSIYPFPVIFSCFTATHGLHLKTELFSVSSKSEVCPCRRVCLFFCELEVFSSWSAQLEWCLPGCW